MINMEFLSLVLFFLYTWSFGFLLCRFVKESDNNLEKNLMRMGIGLGVFIFLGFVFNLLRIPLDWRFFLFLAVAGLLFYLFKNHKTILNTKFEIKISKSNISILLMLILFSMTFYMYHKGAFAYPYLEDDDSWSHALVAKYVSIEKTVFEKTSVGFHYLDPYPPAYGMFFGIMHQTNNSVYWTLKFFNALIVSLSIIFFYFFAKVFTNSSKKALFSTFALFAVPAFLSHFIWSIAITMPLFFISFYAIEKIKDDKKWWIIAAIVIASTLTSSPTHSIYFGLFFIIYFIARILTERRLLLYVFLAGLFGLVLSFIVWWLPMIMNYGFQGVLRSFLGGNKNVLSVGGTGDRFYTLSDFIFANEVNMINNPIGIGIVISILTVIGLVFFIFNYKDVLKKENYYKLVLLLWFAFSFYAVNAARFPIKLSPFRAWMLLAIPVSLLSGEALNSINKFVKSAVRGFAKSNIAITGISLVVLGLVGYGIITTSFVQKYTVNTAQWPPGGFWTSNEEIQGYIWFKDNIPSGTKVFTFSNNALILGFDKFICHWCDDVKNYQKNGFNQTADENYNWLKKEQYEYIIIDGQAARAFGANETNNKIQGFISSNKFKPVFNNNGMLMFEIV
jgi:hypothetical protein